MCRLLAPDAEFNSDSMGCKCGGLADQGTSFQKGSERRACSSAKGHMEVVHRNARVLHKSVGISGLCFRVNGCSSADDKLNWPIHFPSLLLL